jgi:NhaP-type Na+/H+ or K+/H+ antiporter
VKLCCAWEPVQFTKSSDYGISDRLISIGVIFCREIYKELGVPKRLSTLVDGESLFNDATAIVIFNILLGIIGSGTAFSASVAIDGIGQFLLVFFGGLVVGAVLGAAMLWTIALGRKDHMVQAVLTSVLAYRPLSSPNISSTSPA